MKRCSCAHCERVVEKQLTSIRIDPSISEKSNEPVTKEGEEMDRTSSPQPDSLTDDDTESSDEFNSYASDVDAEMKKLKTSDHRPEPKVNSSFFKPSGDYHRFRTVSRHGRVDRDYPFSVEAFPYGHRGKSTPSSSSANSDSDSETENDDVGAEYNLKRSSYDGEKSPQDNEDVDTSFYAIYNHSVELLRSLDYELFKCVMGMQEALETAHRAVRKLRNAQSMVNDLGRDLNASLGHVSASLLNATAIKAKQAELSGEALSHHRGM
ncbi:hypothetical protein TcWFU_008857 [Taenia crassiceps]|uniref:Uncharacterized protein n=1 Tax=Taenia crassiceps TaxID=6207 RepID=A0ABR4Q454_9CEST